MSNYLIKRRSDANHKAIVEELLARGIDVIDLANSGNGVADIVTHYKNKTVFIEIKCGQAKLKKTQVRFLSAWSGYCGIARNIEEALALASNPIEYGLTDPQKEKLAIYYRTMTVKEVHLPTIDKLLKS